MTAGGRPWSMCRQLQVRSKKPRTVDAMVRDAPAAPARARLARTRTTHSPTPYLTSGERSSQTKSTVHNCHDRRARQQQIAPDTTGLTLNLQTTSKNHGKRPELPRDAQFSPATGLGAKNPKLEAAMLLQNARTSCRRPTTPQMPPPSPRADNFDRPLGNISASRGTWLAPPTAP